jgi:hypothetical protein
MNEAVRHQFDLKRFREIPPGASLGLSHDLFVMFLFFVGLFYSQNEKYSLQSLPTSPSFSDQLSASFHPQIHDIQILKLPFSPLSPLAPLQTPPLPQKNLFFIHIHKILKDRAKSLVPSSHLLIIHQLELEREQIVNIAHATHFAGCSFLHYVQKLSPFPFERLEVSLYISLSSQRQAQNPKFVIKVLEPPFAPIPVLTKRKNVKPFSSHRHLLPLPLFIRQPSSISSDVEDGQWIQNRSSNSSDILTDTAHGISFESSPRSVPCGIGESSNSIRSASDLSTDLFNLNEEPTDTF